MDKAFRCEFNMKGAGLISYTCSHPAGEKDVRSLDSLYAACLSSNSECF